MIVFSIVMFHVVQRICHSCLRYKNHKSKDCGPYGYYKIRIADDEVTCNDLATQLLRNCKNSLPTHALGFDCEWQNTANKTRQPIALLQLCSDDGLCVLFRLNRLNAMHMPVQLKALLEDPSVLKVGVSSLVDAMYLLEDKGVIVKGCIDLRNLSDSEAGLATLAKIHLNVIMNKDTSVRCSNWEADVLNKQQVEYAAIDALASLKIFRALIGVERTLKKCKKFIDVPFRAKLTCIKPRQIHCSDKLVCCSKPSTLKTIKGPLYEGIIIQKPDGSTLVTCNAQKANWYLKKELADKISDDPLVIRLKFEPKLPSSEDRMDTLYYSELKENCCVVCGSTTTTSHLRKNIVPVEYRKHFPVEWKSHMSHDVLLMCTTCHAKSISHDRKLRQHLVELCQAPFAENQLVLLPELVTLTTAAKTLLAQSGVPESRIRECHSIIVDYIERLDYDNGTLADIAGIKPKIKDSSYTPHGEKVVEYYKKGDGGTFRLQTMWRQHFIDSMAPHFLPKYWSVSHGQTIAKENGLA